MTGTITRPPMWADEPSAAGEVEEGGGEYVEPRLRARRVEVREAERRRRRRVLLSLIALVLVSGLGVGSLYSPLLDLDHLDIEGLRHLEPDAVEEASGLATGQQLVDLDTDRAVSHIDRLPWVDRVTVTRRWPDTVEVRIVERETIGVVALASGERLVVTRDGMVAGPAGALDADAQLLTLDPALTATVGERLDDALTRGIQMLDALPLALRFRSTGARTDAAGGIEVTLTDGAVLVLGDGEDAEEKFLAAETILGGTVALECLERADVSVPSAPVIVRASGCR